jgi:hypothetical protein
MRRGNIHEKFNAFCPLFADSDELSMAGGRRLAVGGGDAANPACQSMVKMINNGQEQSLANGGSRTS